MKSASHNMERPAPLKTDINMSNVFKVLKELTNNENRSTARYLTFDSRGGIFHSGFEVCYNSAPTYCQQSKGFAIAFQGYGGFKEGDRWRDATEADLYTNQDMPFVMEDKGYYNEVSLKWLDCLLNPEGPFKALLPHMMENTPEEVQKRRGFIFPEVSSVPGSLLWCFAIASRLGFANPRVVWRYLHMLQRGVSKNMALLIAGGFEHAVQGGEITGKLIKSYTAGFLGADVTAYAGRILYADPVLDAGLTGSTYGSSKCFLSGKMDMANLRFDDWDAVIQYCQSRADEQRKAQKKAA